MEATRARSKLLSGIGLPRRNTRERLRSRRDQLLAKVVKRRPASPDKQPQVDKTAIREFRQGILEWYQRYGRQFPWRQATSCYERIVAEILLQRTQANTVAKFYPRFIEKYPSWEVLAQAAEGDLQVLLQPIGLWRRRAHTMVALASVIVGEQGRLPSSRDELESLPGISQYMASSILLLCHGERVALVDVNVARVLERVFGERHLSDIRYDPYLQNLAQRVVRAGDPVSCNWAIIDLASAICLPTTPKCSICPLRGVCRFAAASSALPTGV